MNQHIDLIWWISAIEIPVVSGLIWFVQRMRRDSDDRLEHYGSLFNSQMAQLRESLSSFKIEVAQSYATVRDLREVENRIVVHLSRIESKLDSQAYRVRLYPHSPECHPAEPHGFRIPGSVSPHAE